MTSLYVGSHYDATPVDVMFGAMQGLLMPHARYFHLGPSTKKWVPLSLQTYQDLTKRTYPRSGVVELSAQSYSVSWWTSPTEMHVQDIILHPRILQNGRAITIYSAVQKGVRQLSVKELN